MKADLKAKGQITSLNIVKSVKKFNLQRDLEVISFVEKIRYDLKIRDDIVITTNQFLVKHYSLLWDFGLAVAYI